MLLSVVVCSTRPGRASRPIADWFFEQARAHGRFDVELADLIDFALPVFDEPSHPRLGDYQHEHTKRWSAAVDRADAFVFVTPEYNHAPPSPLGSRARHPQAASVITTLPFLRPVSTSRWASAICSNG